MQEQLDLRTSPDPSEMSRICCFKVFSTRAFKVVVAKLQRGCPPYATERWWQCPGGKKGNVQICLRVQSRVCANSPSVARVQER
eukprot:1487964-Amphidinium_carterae.1